MKRGEAVEQEALIQWCQYQEQRLPGLNLLYAVPNGGSRNKMEAANLKRQGVRAGVPDLMLPVARQGYHGLFIEMKYGKNTATEQQLHFMKLVKEQGYRAEVCYGWQEAAELLEQYLNKEGD